jgi:hypothetical protein
MLADVSPEARAYAAAVLRECARRVRGNGLDQRAEELLTLADSVMQRDAMDRKRAQSRVRQARWRARRRAERESEATADVA